MVSDPQKLEIVVNDNSVRLGDISRDIRSGSWVTFKKLVYYASVTYYIS